MLSLAPGVRIFIGLDPVDMRSAFKSMVGVARRLGLERLDGHFYLFFNRRRQLCRMIWFDGSGWCLLSKRLEKGTFELPTPTEGARQVAVDSATLTALLEGIDLIAQRRRWYRRPAA